MSNKPYTMHGPVIPGGELTTPEPLSAEEEATMRRLRDIMRRDGGRSIISTDRLLATLDAVRARLAAVERERDIGLEAVAACGKDLRVAGDAGRRLVRALDQIVNHPHPPQNYDKTVALAALEASPKHWRERGEE